MGNKRDALRAGIFMLVSLALILFVIVAISGMGRFTQSFNIYRIKFSLGDDIGGLRAGDDVRLGGLKVGTVTDIRIAQEIPAVVVYVEVPAKYRLGGDADVEVQRGLTGTAAINIQSFGTGPQIASGDFLQGQPDPLAGLISNLKIASVKLNTDLDKLGTTADSFSATGFAATSTVGELHVRLPEIIDEYKSVTQAAVKMLEVIRGFVGPSSGDFHQTVANLKQVTGDVRDRLPDVLDRTRGILAKVDIAVGRASDAMKSIVATADNARAATGSLRSVLVDNHAKLQQIITSLAATSDNLKYASTEIRHSPWRLLYQPKPDEMANLNTYDSVRQFAEGANSLDDAAASLRDALNDPNADPAQVKLLMDHLNDSFAKFQQVQDKLWNQVKQ
jgi:phospholipid/cholesterol/gamma-HCH transport system substrate-binding protein